MPPRFQADQIGSLIRPQYLLDAHHAVSDWGRMHSKYNENATPELIKKAHDAERRAIKDVVMRQIDQGVVPISSGEFERASFVSGFFEKLDGIEIRFLEWPEFRTDFPMARPYIRRSIPGRDVPIAIGKVRWKQSTYMDEWMYVRSLLPEERWKDVKMTIPAPNWSHTQLKDGNAYLKDAYADDEEYLRDMGEAVRQEVLALYGAGVRFIQIDDPMVAMMCDQAYLDAQKKEGKDMDALLDPAILAHNAVLRDLPADLTLAVHLCRGNIPKGETAAIGGFDDMMPKLFREMNYNRFALEFDDPEVTGSFSALQHLPADKTVVLGLVTTKEPEIEDLEELKCRVYEAADIIASGQNRERVEILRENLAVSPSCGFASLNVIHGINSEDVQWAKLNLVKRLAEELLSGK